MKTLKQLRDEIEVQKAIRRVAEEKSDLQRNIKQAKKELSYLKHPSKQVLINYAHKTGSKFKKVGGTVSRNLKGMGKMAYEAGKSQAKAIRSEQIRKGYQSQHILRKRKINPKSLRNLRHRTKRHSKIKHRRIKRLPSRVTYNPYNPFGLDF